MTKGMLELIAEEEESDTETLIESLGNLEAEEKTEVTDNVDSAVQAVVVQYREFLKKFTAKQPEFAASKYYALMKQYIDEVAGDERRKVTGKESAEHPHATQLSHASASSDSSGLNIKNAAGNRYGKVIGNESAVHPRATRVSHASTSSGSSGFNIIQAEETITKESDPKFALFYRSALDILKSAQECDKCNVQGAPAFSRT